MFIQAFRIHTPTDMRDRYEAIIRRNYLGVAESCDGFVFADILYDPQDLCDACLLVYWRDEAACRRATHNSRLIAACLQVAADLPGAEIQQQMYSDVMLAHR